MLPLKSRIQWLLVNAAGIGAFLWVASHFWIEPEVADIPGASGGAAFGWFAEAGPILAVFVVANIAWLGLSMAGERRQRLGRAALAGAILLCWLGAFLLDNAHHGI